MDWSIFGTAFFTALIAELGDKTQLASMALSSQTTATGSVLLGSLLGLSVSATVGIFLGRYMGAALNPQLIHWASGLLFIGVGVWILAFKHA
jgi:putative Ca2+/H+ antiporter (TMEM165/GDT1 family)